MNLKTDERKLFALEVGKTALIIIDMQNDFVRQGGMLYVADALKTVPAIDRLIRFFRRSKMPVLYTKAVIPQAPLLKRKYYEVLHPEWIEGKALVKGHHRYYADIAKTSDCTDIIDEIYPEQDDIIIEKVFYNAFEGTLLEYILRALKIEYLVLVGVATHVCVESTARAAFDKQFMVALV